MHLNQGFTEFTIVLLNQDLAKFVTYYQDLNPAFAIIRLTKHLNHSFLQLMALLITDDFAVLKLAFTLSFRLT